MRQDPQGSCLFVLLGKSSGLPCRIKGHLDGMRCLEKKVKKNKKVLDMTKCFVI